MGRRPPVNEPQPAGPCAREDRRRALKQAAGIAAATGLPFIGRSAQAQQTVRIGLVIAKQGPFAQQGSDLSAGIHLAFEEAGRRVLGQPAELVWLDEANPQGAVQSITKLIEEQKVMAVLGGTNSATSLAMGPVAQRAKVPFVSVNGVAREITGSGCNPYMFRMPPSIPVYARAMAPHMLAMGKRWYFIAGSFAMGDDVVATYSQILKDAGGTVVGVDSVPVATTDYSSFVLKARNARPDIVISGAPNVEPILKQFKEMGLTGKIPVAGPAVSDTDLWSATPEALGGIYGKSWYYNDPSNSPEEKAFTATYLKREGRPPSDRVFFGWHSMKLLLAAVASAKSVQPAAVARGLEEMRLQDGSLPLSFRKWDHQLTRRVVVATARANPRDKWDILDVKPTQIKDAADLEHVYGTQAEVGCRMAPA
jgi:branched-chain amino acid transport system substrate-binding protein